MSDFDDALAKVRVDYREALDRLADDETQRSAEKGLPDEEPTCSHCGGVGHTIGAHF